MQKLVFLIGEYVYARITLLYLIQKEIILYLEKNYTLFRNLAVATQQDVFVYPTLI